MYYFKGDLQILTKETSTYSLYTTRQEHKIVSD